MPQSNPYVIDVLTFTLDEATGNVTCVDQANSFEFVIKPQAGAELAASMGWCGS